MRAALAIVLVAGCTPGFAKTPKPAAAQPSQRSGSTFGVAGEAMEYQVSLRGVTVGRVQVAVGQPGWVAGHRAIIVRSRGASAGFLSLVSNLRWELTTTLDLATGLPLHEIEESWLQAAGEPEHDRTDHDWHGAEYNLHAAAGALRAWHSQLGARIAFEVQIDQGDLEVELWDAAREYVPAVHQPAVRYDGIAREKYHFSLWISDDAARVPLLLRTDTKWGAVAVELVSYDPPAT